MYQAEKSSSFLAPIAIWMGGSAFEGALADDDAFAAGVAAGVALFSASKSTSFTLTSSVSKDRK